MIIILALLLALAHASKTEFEAWTTQHTKKYGSETEYLYRYAVFLNNKDKVERLNKESRGGALFGLNKYADWTAEEFRGLLGYVGRNETVEREYLELGVGAVPESFDWESKGKVTAVKDQGQCGSCWAFSATENIESVWMIAKNLHVSNFKPLAPQQIVDCDKVDAGCNGGDTPTAFEYVIKAGGQDTEASYPYKAIDQACHFKAADVEAKIASYKYATKTKNEAEMKDAVATVAPLSICVDAEPWQFYTSGVMTKAQCGTSLDHCVQITAYDTAAKPAYWKVRNSWGADWGEKGFIRLEYGTNTCGVAEEPTTAVV
uniref:Uncharacterized protein n=1 Tax=Arcella intermedia TaxID=1963864 RepID=A0A6B2LA85_9EUKA|eukprot:TRINITY_DN528_c0_g1_i1.p1 TRINITY_DN528_c0_g1~~TRINITY_DN528_c0_g1_i1.p1  ORF type:complete len:317 (+),score=15.54 TRINITY_DN528_c0_g1_i1:74-1024(+)